MTNYIRHCTYPIFHCAVPAGRLCSRLTSVARTSAGKQPYHTTTRPLTNILAYSHLAPRLSRRRSTAQQLTVLLQKHTTQCQPTSSTASAGSDQILESTSFLTTSKMQPQSGSLRPQRRSRCSTLSTPSTTSYLLRTLLQPRTLSPRQPNR